MKTRKLAIFLVRNLDLRPNWAKKGFSSMISKVFDPKIVVLLLYLCSARKKSMIDKHQKWSLKGLEPAT